MSRATGGKAGKGNRWIDVGRSGVQTRRPADSGSDTDNVPVDELTPDDIYDAGVATDEARSSENKEREFIDRTLDLIKGAPIAERLETLGTIAAHAIGAMSEALGAPISKAKDSSENQQTVIVLNTAIDNVSDPYYRVTLAIGALEEIIVQMNRMKEAAIADIKKFLVSCGIRDVKEADASPLAPPAPNAPLADIALNARRTYASAIGAATSGLIVDAKPRAPEPSGVPSAYADTGIVEIPAPVIRVAADCQNLTMSYLSTRGVFVMRIGGPAGSVFTLGPGNFVNLQPVQGKTRHAKHCRNPQPCGYDRCRYYHDPSITGQNSNTHRNLALSYVIQMLGCVKDDEDLMNNGDRFKRDEFLRDLVQLGGMILLKAAKIQALYFRK